MSAAVALVGLVAAARLDEDPDTGGVALGGLGRHTQAIGESSDLGRRIPHRKLAQIVRGREGTAVRLAELPQAPDVSGRWPKSFADHER